MPDPVQVKGIPMRRLPFSDIMIALVLGWSATGLAGELPAQEAFIAPRIWDPAKLAGWDMPRAHDGLRENYISEEDYYSSPGYNTRTYPVYDPQQEPQGYWEWLHTLDPEPLIEAPKARTQDEWERAGREVFDQLDQVAFRVDDTEIINLVRDPKRLTPENTTMTAAGTFPLYRWVVESKGHVVLGASACAGCHERILADGSGLRGAPGNQRIAGPVSPTFRKQIARFLGPSAVDMAQGQILYTLFGVPWLTNDRHALFQGMPPAALKRVSTAVEVPGTFARLNGSPFWINKMPDLRGIRQRRFLDATATHLNRDVTDVARYAAKVAYAGVAGFGGYRFLPDDAPRPLFHFDDDVLFALAMFLYSLEPAENPMRETLNPALVARGREVFEREDCRRCHEPPDYSGSKLLPVEGFDVDKEHPFKNLIYPTHLDTDPGLALNTRKGTGFYKIPSLRGLWCRGLFGHSGSVASLEDWFDPRRLQTDYEPTGWKGPGVKQRAVPGHRYGLDLDEAERRALIAFLLTL